MREHYQSIVSSVESGNGWLLLLRARDHVWRDMDAAKILWDLSIQIAMEARKPRSS